MSKLRVGLFPADHGGCGYYRVIWPWVAVGEMFADEIEVVRGDLADQTVIAWEGGEFEEGEEPTEYHIPRDIVSLPPYDVMIFQRPLHSKYAHYFKLLRERGVFVVVDLDDNFDRIDTHNVAWYGAEPHWLQEREVRQLAKKFGGVNITRKGGPNQEFLFAPAHMGAVNRMNIRAALQHTDLLITSTPNLAEHYGGLAARTVVIENHVPGWYFNIAKEAPISPVPIVGWTGSIATHPSDLQQMGGALVALRRREIPFFWSVVGTGAGVREATGMAPDTTTRGWVDLQGDYQRAYAALDIAVCPLDPSSFNIAKSWLKPLEAAALGVVPVMSPLPEYTRISDLGIGLVAKRPREWEGILRRLLTDEAYRVEIGERSHAIAKEMTYEKNAHKWAGALERAMRDKVAA